MVDKEKEDDGGLIEKTTERIRDLREQLQKERHLAEASNQLQDERNNRLATDQDRFMYAFDRLVISNAVLHRSLFWWRSSAIVGWIIAIWFVWASLGEISR